MVDTTARHSPERSCGLDMGMACCHPTLAGRLTKIEARQTGTLMACREGWAEGMAQWAGWEGTALSNFKGNVGQGSIRSGAGAARGRG